MNDYIYVPSAVCTTTTILVFIEIFEVFFTTVISLSESRLLCIAGIEALQQRVLRTAEVETGTVYFRELSDPNPNHFLLIAQT